MPWKGGDVAWRPGEIMVEWGSIALKNLFFAGGLLRGEPGNHVQTYEFWIGHRHRPAISGGNLDRTSAQILAFMSA